MKTQVSFALAIASTFWLAGATARSQQVEVEVGESLVCDTQNQVERFVALFDGNAGKTVAAVNDEVQDPTACGVVAVAFVRGRNIAMARTRTGTFQIMRILVLGVVTDSGIRPAHPAVFYSMTQIEERGA